MPKATISGCPAGDAAGNLTGYVQGLRYDATANGVSLGPWQGSLGNAGETLELKRPDTSNTNRVPYILVEQVHYLDRTPWPAIADGADGSIQRVEFYAGDVKLAEVSEPPDAWSWTEPRLWSPGRTARRCLRTHRTRPAVRWVRT